MTTNQIRMLFTGAIALVLVITVSMISYRIIDAFCKLGEREVTTATSLSSLNTQMQSLKDWGGLVLGFFFGAGFNFIVLTMTQRDQKRSATPEDAAGEVEPQHGPASPPPNAA